MNLKRLWVMIVICCVPMSASAWSAKEHIMLTRIAARELISEPTTPSDMKQWLSQALAEVPDMEGEERYFMTRKVGMDPKGFTGLLFYSFQPDIHQFYDKKDTKVAPFNVHEKKLHFIDIEFFIKGDKKREYLDDLSNKSAIDDIPKDMTDKRYEQAGMLPFRVEYCYNKLVECLKADRFDKATSKIEDEDDTATRWAGYLAHYAGDNTQPQHATVDYKSQSYFTSTRKAPNVHAEVEYRMVDDEVDQFPALRKEYWPMFISALDTVKDKTQSDDPFRATLEVSLKSYDALPLIGAAAKNALIPVEGNTADKVDTEKFFHFTGKVNGEEMTVMQMKANQQALAVHRIKRLWMSAWKAAKG